jgi:hypothetical protein
MCSLLISAFIVQLHLVHYNTDLYASVQDALTQEKGLTVFGIFLQVRGCHLTSTAQNLVFYFFVQLEGDTVRVFVAYKCHLMNNTSSLTGLNTTGFIQ